MEIAMDRPALLEQAVGLGVSVSHKHKTVTPFSATTTVPDLAVPSLPRPLPRLEQVREGCLTTKTVPLVRAFSAPLPQQLHNRQEVFLEVRMLGGGLGLETNLVLEEDSARTITLDFLEIVHKQQRHLFHLVRHPQLGVDLEEGFLDPIIRLPPEEVCSEATHLSRPSDRSQRPLPQTYSGEELSSQLLVDLEPEPMSRKLVEGCSVALLPLREVIFLGVQIRQIQLLALSAPTTTTKPPAQASSVQSQRLLARTRCSEDRTTRPIPAVRHSLALDLEITTTNPSKVLLVFSEVSTSSNQPRLCLAIPLGATTVTCLRAAIIAALSSTIREQTTIRTKLGKVSSRIPPIAMATILLVVRSKMCCRLRSR